MQNYLVECAYNSKDDLGESPIWIEEQNSIFWVDIKKCIIHRLNTESNKTEKEAVFIRNPDSYSLTYICTVCNFGWSN